MLTAISLLPQPCNEINISEELRELTKMEKTAISLKPSLKFFANIIISWIRSDNVTNAIMIARKWFQAIKNPTRDFGEAASLFLQSTMELNTNSDDLEKFFDSFCYLSASLGDNEDTFDKYSELVRTQHEEIFLVVKDILKGEKHMTKVSLKISSSIVFITSLSRYGNVKKDGYLNLYNEKYKKVIIHFAHDPNRLKSSKYLFKAMKDIYKLIALDVISRLNDYNEKLDVQTLLSPLIKNLLHRRVNGEIVQPILQTLSSRLLELNPIEFDFTQKNKYDIDSIVDKMYEKVEIFRECANIILRESNVKNMKEEKLMGILMKHNIVSFEASALALNGLSISNLRNSHVIETFLTGFSTILNGISLFDSTTFRIYKQADSINFKLRQLNRNLARQLDSFINMIERLPSPEIPSTPFLQSVQQMQDKLCDVLFSMADIISHALISLVEEMYRNNRNEVLEKKLLPSFKIFNESVATVRSQAVGQTASDFAGVLIQIEFHFNNFIDCSSKINFTKSLFPVKKLLEISGNMGESIMRLSKIVPTLTDILIINPDPDSADKIPEKFEPKMTNQQISDNLTPHDVLSSIQSQSTKILNNLTEAKKVFSEYSVDSDVIIEIIEKIDNDSNKFISFSRQMISVCTDQRLGELQTSIFSFISVVSNLHVAIRNRLLREGNFDQDINEAISQFGPQIESTINLASAAVKNFEEKSAVIEEEIIDTIEDTSSASDEVTRELQATANAINEMNARLAKFSAQISTIEEPIQDEGIDIIDENTNDLAEESNNGLQRQEMNLNAEQGTLPAFVISNASPVLEMTSLILQRAQVITKQKMMESGGHLQNEKALIKCAQDLSEAAELLLIVAEILISKAESDTEYKVISAAKIIKASVAAFVAKIQQLGGDSEGKMNEYVKKVVIHADAVVTKGESIAIEKMIEEESKVQKKVMNKFTLRLNLQSDLNNLETVLKQQEDALKQFNRKF